MNYANLVLLFNTKAPTHRAAQLHLNTCSMVNAAGTRRVVKVDTEVAEAVADLEEREFPVTRCKCCPKD